jgi:hypothetical protein
MKLLRTHRTFPPLTSFRIFSRGAKNLILEKIKNENKTFQLNHARERNKKSECVLDKYNNHHPFHVWRAKKKRVVTTQSSFLSCHLVKPSKRPRRMEENREGRQNHN